jgi:hypothetical protein
LAQIHEEFAGLCRGGCRPAGESPAGRPSRTRKHGLNRCEWHFHPEEFARPTFKAQDAIDFWDMTNRQDWHVCELSQKVIRLESDDQIDAFFADL